MLSPVAAAIDLGEPMSLRVLDIKTHRHSFYKSGKISTILPHGLELSTRPKPHSPALRPSTNCSPQPSFTSAPWRRNQSVQKARWAGVWMAASAGRRT